MIPRLVVPLLKINYVFLVPWIVLSVPPTALFGQTVIILIVLSFLGLAGMLMANSSMAMFASVGLLTMIVWGKIASDIYALPAPDSALLLLQFMLVIFLMEASRAVLTFDNANRRLAGKTDEFSLAARVKVTDWTRAQLVDLGRLTVAAVGLSLGLLVFGSIVSISVNQLVFSAVLVISVVVTILVLLTYKREPEQRMSLG